tara:strand:+ start:1631 stop:2809 length:1179 start_codon:yes stop_codon:yes gene_type:complete
MIQEIKTILKDYSFALGSGTILTILVALLYKYSRGEKQEKSIKEKIIEQVNINEQKINEQSKIISDSKMIVENKKYKSEELKQMKILMEEFMKQIKDSSDSLVYFNNERKINSNYLNIRNQLFTKDIETKKILIDTKNIVEMGYTYDTSNYIVDIGSNGKYPESFKNVIGFRLVKCVIPVCLFHVKDGHNIFDVTVGTTTYSNVTIDVGNYTFETLGAEIQKQLKTVDTNFSVDRTTHFEDRKYEINNSGGDFSFTFKENNLARLFGLALDKNNTSSMSSSNSLISDHPIDKSIHYIDLVIPEIPHMACKLNSVGQHVIDRIPMVSEAGTLNYYETPLHEYLTQNYFYPIKLNKLTIQLYEDSENNFYTTNGRDNYFEFEITILKNTKLMNA